MTTKHSCFAINVTVPLSKSNTHTYHIVKEGQLPNTLVDPHLIQLQIENEQEAY